MIAASDTSSRTARLAGMLYLALLPLGIFSFVYVPTKVLVPGDMAATARSLLESQTLIRYGSLSHLVTQVVVVFLALALYRLLASVDPHTAAAMVALALLGIPISFVAEVDHLAVLRLLGSGGDGAFTSAQVQTQAMLSLEKYRSTVLLAQIFWGLWLLPLAWLIWRAGFLPRALAVVVAIASTGYLVDSVGHILNANLPVMSRFTSMAEIVLPLWLVTKGVDPRANTRAETDGILSRYNGMREKEQ